MLKKLTAFFVLAATVLTIAYCLFGVGAEDVCVVSHAGAGEKSTFPGGEGKMRSLHSPPVEVGPIGELPIPTPDYIWPQPAEREPEFIIVHYTAIDYRIQAGDTLWTLEDRFGVPFEILFAMNRELLERNYQERCPAGRRYPLSYVGHCSSPQATLQCGMLIRIPDEILIEPVYGTWM